MNELNEELDISLGDYCKKLKQEIDEFAQSMRAIDVEEVRPEEDWNDLFLVWAGLDIEEHILNQEGNS